MAQTPSFYVNSPTSGTEYVANQAAYEFIPNNGTSYTVTVKAWSGANGTGSLVTVTTITAIDHNVTSNTDPNSFTQSSGNTANATSSNGTNGSNVFCAAGKYTGGAIGSLEIFAVYTGAAVLVPSIFYGDPSNNGVVHSIKAVFYGDPSNNGVVHSAAGVWVPNGAGVKQVF